MTQIVKKAKRTIKQAWSLGEKKFEEGYKIRMILFDSIFRRIILYNTDIWGWTKQPKLEKLQRNI